MIDNGYIFAKDNKRIFINTSLGCSGGCEYCYLPQVGYNNNSDKYQTIKASEIINLLEESNININNKTLITLGCYSECMSEYNKQETIDIIKYFLAKGNQIELSTKKQIYSSDLKEILPLIKYHGQLVVFVSSATISKQTIIEKNTTNIKDRLNNFALLNKLNIPCVLYMKPILKGITIKDKDLYKKYIIDYKIKDVVVGSIFTKNKTNEQIPFGSKIELYYNKNSDEDIIIKELEKITNVYKRSTEVMKKYYIDLSNK